MKKMNLLFVLLLTFAISMPVSLTFAATKDTKNTATTSITEKVNINSVSIDMLTTVPGIGPKTAMSIVNYREKNGNFVKIDDLTAVKGIGDKSLKKMKPYLTL